MGGERLGGATCLSLPILLMSLRHVNVRLPKIELHCMQISSYSLAETALALRRNIEKVDGCWLCCIAERDIYLPCCATKNARRLTVLHKTVAQSC